MSTGSKVSPEEGAIDLRLESFCKVERLFACSTVLVLRYFGFELKGILVK
ncbi:MAG: hypothetical protein DF168_00256 [Candidatus Moanabacter tarae]|uniref:Uncharacterized protein n=1 Tax=Candidatus Moanibacter tarae TaxID=2200854 RepID=A0A2Z4AKE2_9BACT|nr:MAG: hypothetical protein DF168_00256 [Candidatus Moanabacter tarae]